MLNALNDQKVSSAKHTIRENGDEKPKRLTDGGGLYLMVLVNGRKYFRFDYSLGGVRKTAGVGVYPKMSLKTAREVAASFRELVQKGIDPVEFKREKRKALETKPRYLFKNVAASFISQKKKTWGARRLEDVERQLNADVLPCLATVDIRDITASQILEMMRIIERRGASHLANRVRGLVGQIIDFACVNALRDSDKANPARALRGAINNPDTKHRPAITDPRGVGELMRRIVSYQWRVSPVVSCALRILPYVFARPIELRNMRWEDIDIDAKEWRYFISKTKTPHIVPLSNQALSIIEEIRPHTGHGLLVFPSTRGAGRGISENTLNASLRAIGYGSNEMCSHGFRSMARTLWEEQLNGNVAIIEHQLGHTVSDPLGRAYNRTSFIKERRVMMQVYADYLDRLRDGEQAKDINLTQLLRA